MYDRILVPLDGSKRAEVILPHVEEMAQRYDAEVVLLYVAEPTLPVVAPMAATHDYRTSIANYDQQIEDAKLYLAGWRGELREKGIRAKYVIESGPVVQRILEVAVREVADIIAMASHGHTGLARAFYGSVAAGVLHQTDRLLLLVRATTGD